MLAWMIQRSRLPGAGVLEYIVMFPQAVPRLVFAFGMMWAWLVFPIPIYGTIWILLIAYLTVFLPLGVRTISGVIMHSTRVSTSAGSVRRVLGLPPAHHHRAAAAAGAAGGLAVDLRGQRARTRGFDPADGAALQSDDTCHRRGLLLDQFRTHRGDGADPDRHRRRGDGGVHADHAPRLTR